MRIRDLNWRSGRGWFRVWVLLALIWYAVAAVILLRSDFTRQLTFQSHEFSAETELQAHLRKVEETAAVRCAANSLRVKAYSRGTRGSDEADWADIAAQASTRPSERAAISATLPPLRTVYGASAECTDQYEIIRMTIAAVAAFVAPFAAVVTILLAFHALRIVAGVGRAGLGGAKHVRAWLGEGFQVQPLGETLEGEESAGRATFVPEFWSYMKPVLTIAAVALVVVWIAFSVATGIRSGATMQALGRAVGGSVVLLLVGIIAYAVRLLRRS